MQKFLIETNLESKEIDFIAGRSVFRSGHYDWMDRRPFDWTLLMTLDGEGCICIDDNNYFESKGSIILGAPTRSRRFKTDQNWTLLWFHFMLQEPLASSLAWPQAAPTAFRLKMEGREFRRAARALLEAIDLSILRLKNWYPLAKNLLESVIWRGNERTLSISCSEQQVLRAQRLLLDPVREKGIDSIAKRCGMSRSVFYSHFKNVFGISPRKYNEMHALRKAKLLLEGTSMPIAEIAERVSMANVYYFSSRFKKTVGVSPSAYRKGAMTRTLRLQEESCLASTEATSTLPLETFPAFVQAKDLRSLDTKLQSKD